MTMLSPTDRLIRKLRKKLRQIERLELLGHTLLNEEELYKVKQKSAIRAEIALLLKQDEQSIAVEPCCKQSSENLGEPETAASDCLSNFPATLAQDDLRSPISELTSGAATDAMKRSSVEELCAPDLVPESNSNKKQKNSKEETENSKEKSKMDKASNKKLPATKAWHDTPFILNELDVHNDIVFSVDIDEDYIISGSRDTVVQVWCAKTGSSLESLRGHTNTVTCASLLSAEDSRNLFAALVGAGNQEKSPRLAITGSSDCCLKLWNIETGSALRSIYTFSGITSMCYLPNPQFCVIGSEGGKLEIFTFLEESANPIFSVKPFDSSITAIKLQGDNLVCSSLDGTISLWTLKGIELCKVYQTEDLISSETGQTIRGRPILCLDVSSVEPMIFYGDEGANVKTLAWRTGSVKKLRNHIHDFGITNAICATRSFLFSSAVNLDTGRSFVNVRSTSNNTYLGTLSVPNIDRISCLAAIEDNQNLRVVIGGSKLLLVETRGIGCQRSPKKDSILKPQFLSGLNLPTVDSEAESSTSSDELEEDTTDEFPDSTVAEVHGNNQNSSWCLIL